MRRVLLSSRSVSAREEIGDWIARDSPARALRFVQEIRRRVTRIGRFPSAAPLRPDLAPDIRVAVFRGYLIAYTLEAGGDVVVQRVVHGARTLPALFASNDRERP